MEFAVRQAEINTHKEGLSKTLEQNQLNYEQGNRTDQTSKGG